MIQPAISAYVTPDTPYGVAIQGTFLIDKKEDLILMKKLVRGKVGGCWWKKAGSAVSIPRITSSSSSSD